MFTAIASSSGKPIMPRFAQKVRAQSKTSPSKAWRFLLTPLMHCLGSSVYGCLMEDKALALSPICAFFTHPVILLIDHKRLEVC